MNLQMENIDLETQLKDISASIENKHKVTEKDMQHENISSTSNDHGAQGSMRQIDTKQITAINRKQALRLQIPEVIKELEIYTKEALITFKNNISAEENISIHLKTRLHRRLKDIWHLHFSWLWECRGNPTVLL